MIKSFHNNSKMRANKIRPPMIPRTMARIGVGLVNTMIHPKKNMDRNILKKSLKQLASFNQHPAWSSCLCYPHHSKDTLLARLSNTLAEKKCRGKRRKFCGGHEIFPRRKFPPYFFTRPKLLAGFFIPDRNFYPKFYTPTKN